MKTQTTCSVVLLAGLLLTQGAQAHTGTLADTAAQNSSIETIVVTAAKTVTAPEGVTANSASLLQSLKEAAAKELQQQVAAGSFLPELMQSLVRKASQELVGR